MNELLKLKIRKKHVYGKELTYPACDKAMTFAALLNRKTFTEDDMKIIGSLGYQFEQVF